MKFRNCSSQFIIVGARCWKKNFLEDKEAEYAERKCSSAKDGVVVFSEIYYPEWQATIDGQPVDIARADYVLRVMNIPAGEHTICLLYTSRCV